MNTLKQIEQLKRLHKMIKRETTGSPRMVARKMHISERQLYNLVDQLRTLDAPIRFDRRSNTYFYTHDFDLLVNISIQVIQNEKVNEIYAGAKNVKFSSFLQGLCSPQNYFSEVMTF